jgi:hypothetical protein
MTLSAPPAFLAGIPDRLLKRRRGAADLRRANELVRYCEERRQRPSFLDLERERARR